MSRRSRSSRESACSKEPAPDAELERPRVAMVLAAGRGERMRPLTDSIPKPLLRVRGKPLIEHHIERLAQAGIARIVVNLAWLGSKIKDYLGDGSRYGVGIIYSEEQPSALEAGGGIFRALLHLRPGAFLVVNADVYTDFPFARAGIAKECDAHLVLVPNPPQHPGGDFGMDAGLALPGAAERYTFAGIAVYRAEFFAECTDGAFPLKPLLLRSMAAGRCSAELYRGEWCDVGTAERLHALNAPVG